MTINRPVNVASVPQRSPFRYPGGKTWLVPRLREWLNSQPSTPTLFVEPFAGGGISALTAVCENLVERAVMVEMDDALAAVWQVALDPAKCEVLCERILSFDVTLDNVREVLDAPFTSLQEEAFRTIVKNRVNRGGILAAGAGLIKEGEGGKGLKSRWYPETLAKRLRVIAEHSSRIDFIQGDGLAVMEQHADNPHAVFLIDPPYTAGKGKRAGRRLYSHSELDHERLFDITKSLKGDFLMTYDNDADVKDLADRRGFEYRAIAMKNTHHAEMNELLIGRKFEWLP